MNIYLIRHGRQNCKLYNVDVPLAAEGTLQARLLGQRLKKYNINVVYSSDLIRAVETADIVNEYLEKPRVIDKRLRETNFGGFTGLSDDELKDSYKDFLKRRVTMTVDEPYPDGGENCQMVYERAFKVIEEIVEKNYDNVCIIAHGGTIRALLTGIIGADFPKWLVYGRQIENCSITEILYDENIKTFHIERFNDYAHIEDKEHLLRKHFGTGFFDLNKETDKID
jgi:probable phosphoglycerate mutase